MNKKKKYFFVLLVFTVCLSPEIWAVTIPSKPGMHHETGGKGSLRTLRNAAALSAHFTTLEEQERFFELLRALGYEADTNSVVVMQENDGSALAVRVQPAQPDVHLSAVGISILSPQKRGSFLYLYDASDSKETMLDLATQSGFEVDHTAARVSSVNPEKEGVAADFARCFLQNFLRLSSPCSILTESALGLTWKIIIEKLAVVSGALEEIVGSLAISAICSAAECVGNIFTSGVEFRHSKGSFVKVDNQWREFDQSGKQTFTFSEASRDATWIVLYDSSRRFYLRLPANGGKSQWSYSLSGAWIDLYDVIKVK